MAIRIEINGGFINHEVDMKKPRSKHRAGNHKLFRPVHSIKDLQLTRSKVPFVRTTLPSNEAAGAKIGALGGIVKVALSDIFVVERRDRADEIVCRIAESVRSMGNIIDPIIVRQKRHEDATDKRYVLVSGARRLLGTELAGYDSIRAVVVDQMSTADLREIYLSSNIDRGSLDALDLVELTVELADLRLAKAPQRAEPSGGVQPNDLGQTARARETGVSADTMGRYLKIAALPQWLKDEARRSGAAKSHSALLELCKLHSPVTNLAVAAVRSDPDDGGRSTDLPAVEASENFASEERVIKSPAEDELDTSYPRDAGPIPDGINVKDPKKAYDDLLKKWKQSRFRIAFQDAPRETRRRFAENVMFC